MNKGEEKNRYAKKPGNRKGTGRKEPFKKESGQKRSRTKESEDIEAGQAELARLEGRNAILEALKADKPIDTLLVKKGENEGTLKVIIAMAKEKGIVIKEMTKEKLDSLSDTGKHQGIIAYCAAHEYAEVEDIFARAERLGQEPFIVLLDGITDPHNLGAIIRTANAAGVHGIIVPKRRAASLTAAVGKASAGALQYVPVARVSNIAAAVEGLKKRGVWVACADMEGQEFYSAPLGGSIALVIGNEGAGVSRLVKDKCDFAVSIPMTGEIASLNASVAAGVLMYEILRNRRTVQK